MRSLFEEIWRHCGVLQGGAESLTGSSPSGQQTPKGEATHPQGEKIFAVKFSKMMLWERCGKGFNSSKQTG